MGLAQSRHGNGRPLVLLHGTGSHRAVWNPVVGLLAAERDVITLDLPGFGESPPLAAHVLPSPRALAHAVAAHLDELGLERAHVAGNSLGGWVSLELARMSRALSVTALSPSGFFNAREAAFSRRSLFATRASARVFARLPAFPLPGRARDLLSWQLTAHGSRIPAADYAAATRALAFAPGFDAVVVEQTARRFEGGDEIDVPVTIAWAELDRLLPPRQAQEARRRLPAANHLILRDCGHVPTYDDPQQVATVLLDGSAC